MNDSSHIQTGSIIDGRYKLQQEIGRGGFAVIYKAIQISTKQNVAIKLISRQKLEGSSKAVLEMERLKREMVLIGKLKHPNIVRLIDSGYLPDGEFFMVLELIDGIPLSEILAKEGALTPREAGELMFQVLDALCSAHEQGIVHRDLKPHNVIINSTGYRRNAMVLDFGLSAILKTKRGEGYQTLTGAKDLRGTPRYMSPEQIISNNPNQQSDIYAWGLLYAECLAGVPLVDGISPYSILAKHMDDAPHILPECINRDTFYDIITRCVAKATSDRYLLAYDVLRDLEAALLPEKKETIKETPSSNSSSIMNSASILVLVLLVIAAVILLFTFNLSDKDDFSKNKSVVAGDEKCQTHQECENGRWCNPTGECIPLENQFCTVSDSSVFSDKSVLFGSVMTLDTKEYRDRQDAIAMAVREFNNAGGLPGGHKILLIQCDDQESKDRSLLAVNHLKNLGAPVVIGPGFSRIFIDVVTEITTPNGMFAITSSASSAAITNLDDNHLAWRTVLSDAVESLAIAGLIRKLKIKRLLVIARDDVYGKGLWDATAKDLIRDRELVSLSSVFTGRNKASGKLAVAIVNYSDVDDFEKKIRTLEVDEVDTVLILGTIESIDIIKRYEGYIGEVKKKAPRYILSSGGKKQKILHLLDQFKSLEGRVFITSPMDQNKEVFEMFRLRYEAAFNQPAESTKISNAYDAAYVVFYAMCTIPSEQPITGIGIAEGIKKLISGEITPISPVDIGKNRKLLQSGGKINLEGASGSLDFDLDTGDTGGYVELFSLKLNKKQKIFNKEGVFKLNPDGTGKWKFLKGALRK